MLAHMHTHTIDCEPPTVSREEQEMHTQSQEKQILHFKMPWY